MRCRLFIIDEEFQLARGTFQVAVAGWTREAEPSTLLKESPGLHLEDLREPGETATLSTAHEIEMPA